MKVFIQPAFAEMSDPGLDEPLCIHRTKSTSQNDALVIFVHGLGGSRYRTWGSLPAFIFQDLPSVDIGLYRYRTLLGRWRFWRSIDLDSEGRVFADIVRDLTTEDHPYRRIILIGHSMGGLLCKTLIFRLLQSHQENVLSAIRGLILLATPQLGSLKLPAPLWNLTSDARALRPHGKLITDVTATFENYVSSRIDQPVPDRRTIPTFGVLAASDLWVDQLSAGLAIPACQIKNVIGSHTSIVKPRSKDSDAYRFVLSSISQSCHWNLASPAPAPTAPARPRAHRYRVIAFDLDGTLIRGLQFSWTAVWDHLQFPEQVPKTGMRRYRRHQTTYQEWCEWACGQFRRKGLKREHFKDIVKPFTVTKNLHEAIDILRADGFVTAIISGGIDVFLEELIPDADKLFDHIYINHLKFDPDGLISGVAATSYDFEGKAAALELVCRSHGCELAEAVFVGEGFNDEFVVDKAGLTIAYPPTAQGFSTASAVEIEEDDLMKVIDEVVVAG